VKLKRSDTEATKVVYSIKTGPFKLVGKTTVPIPR